jgi:hypothetical protein
VLVLLFTSVCAYIFNKPIEAVVFCIAHLLIRYAFDKQYHSGNTAFCLTVTLSVLFFGVTTTLPLVINLLSVIPICFLISWVGYIAQDRLDLYTINRNLRKRPELSEKEKFIARCKELNYNNFKTDIAVKFFIDKIGIKELWLQLCDTQENPMEYDSLRRMKYRIQKDLFPK